MHQKIQAKGVNMSRKVVLCLIVTLMFMLIKSDSVTYAYQPQLVILLYHHILPEADNKTYANNGWVITQELFESQMEFLYKNQYHTITSGELRAFLYEKQSLPPKSVMITFDDGYMSNYLFAYPVLKQYGFKALLFTITGGIQTKDQDFHPDHLDMLSWMQISASTDVFEYGSHTNALHYITDGNRTGFVSVPLDQAESDLRLSLKRIHNDKLFAYPSGQYNFQLVDMLRNTGVDLAFTTTVGYVNQNSYPLLLNRVTVYPDFDLETFGSVVKCKIIYN